MATQESLASDPGPLQGSVTIDGVQRVLRTGGMKTTALPEEGAQRQLIKPNSRFETRTDHDSLPSSVFSSRRAAMRSPGGYIARSRTTVWKGRAIADEWRKPSLTKRFTSLRLTPVLVSRFGTISPKRPTRSTASTQCRAKYFPVRRRPSLKARSNRAEPANLRRRGYRRSAESCDDAPSDRESCSSLGSSRIDHGPAGPGLHANPKSMRAFATGHGRLVSTLHAFLQKSLRLNSFQPNPVNRRPVTAVLPVDNSSGG
jgi:hypothetical protein